MDRVDIAGVLVGRLDRTQWRAYLARCVDEGPAHHHVSMNASKWVEMRRNPALALAVRRASSVGADGIGIVGASRVLGTPLPERVPGCELADDLMAMAAGRGWRVGLFGGQPSVVETVAQRLRSQRVNLVYREHGFHGPRADGAIADAIREQRPDLLLVALGTPRAELFLDRYGARMQAALGMGVGGTFDVWAGRARRAPQALQDAGLEWAWRWAGAPRARFGRAVADSARFVSAVARGRRIRA